jgi:hypothetical protein
MFPLCPFSGLKEENMQKWMQSPPHVGN